jgi:3-isopropylmalate/(R)-2-methylmalate dehydratase small subunit
MSGAAVRRVQGRAIVVRGDDIDTDRIMPARFLKAVTFEGLEQHLFEDDRQEAAAAGLVHPFDDPARRGAAILMVGRNFGCGSSREHAPQAIARWGIRAIVGESFAEIFFGNALMLGLPCLTADRSRLELIANGVTADSTLDVVVDLELNTVMAGNFGTSALMPEAARQALLSGSWDATSTLLEDYDAVKRVASGLPYISGF